MVVVVVVPEKAVVCSTFRAAVFVGVVGHVPLCVRSSVQCYLWTGVRITC